MADVEEKVLEEVNENIVNEDVKPDLYITIPDGENGVDPVEFASRMKARLGKEHNIIFINPREDV